MWKFAVQRKGSIYVGLVLIAAGVLLKRLVELSLVSDGQIESPRFGVVVIVVQLLVVAAGVFVLIRQPSIRLPSRVELLLPAGSLVATFLVLEVGARLWLNYIATPEQFERYVLFTDIPAAEFAWTPHHYLTYYPTPNYRKGNTSHNTFGYRGENFTLEKPLGVFRIVALGGSSTYDVRIEDNAEIFTAQLEKLLKAEHGYTNVQVINAGVPGYNSWEMLANLEFRVLDLEPDLVILYEGTNDVHARLVDPSAYSGDNSGRRHWWQAPSVALWEQSALLRIVGRMANVSRQVGVDDFVSSPTYLSWPYASRLSERELDPREVLQANPPTFFRRNLENMAAVAAAHDVGILLATWAYSPYLNDYASLAYYQDGFQENNAVVKDVAEDRQVPLFDFAAVMPQDALYWADGRHVNEAGALEKARLFAEYLHTHGMIE
jgi:lysophospholipase L1-like esterase